MSEVAIRLRVVGAEESVAQLSRVAERVRQIAGSVPDLARRLGQLGDLTMQVSGAVAAFTATFSRLSGLGVASDIEAITNQLQVLTGDIERARELTKAFYELGAATRFNTNEVAAFGAALLGAGVDSNELIGNMQALLDLIAAMGVRREDMQRVLENIIQIRSLEAGQTSMMDIRQLFRAMPGIGAALGQALGRAPLTQTEANQLLAQLGGREFYNLLIRAAARFEGASQKLTILDALANIAESFEQVLLPTGELFGRLLRAITPLLSVLAGALRRVNQALGGVPGALFALTAATLAAAAALRLLARISAGAGAAQAFGGLGALRGLFGIFRGAGRFARFARVGLAGLGIGLLAELLGGGLEALGLKGAQEAFGVVGNAAGIGVTIGGIIGSIIPGIGTAIGATIGGIVGTLYGLFRLFTGNSQRQADSAQQTAQNTARMAAALEDLRIQLVGGGARARAAATRYEVEAYLRQLAVSGI
jgi:tape measure domain-containing protein